MSVIDFAQQLQIGKIGENRIVSWLRKRGNSVLPVYEIELHTGKGPRLFAPEKEIIAPDLLVLCSDKTIWVEAKNKNAFTWHRITSRWVTGIDLRHYQDYCEIDKTTPYKVWLLFLQGGGQAKDSPLISPSGLYGNNLSYLCKHENHRSDNWGKSGMVYWNIDDLIRFADINEL